MTLGNVADDTNRLASSLSAVYGFMDRNYCYKLITNFMAYGTRRFNVAFARAFQ